MEVGLDGVSYQSRVHGTYHQLDTSDVIMLGMANNNARVQDLTRGHFTQGFQVQTFILKKALKKLPFSSLHLYYQGCMKNISIMGVSLDTTKAEHLVGQNIQECANRKK